MNNNILVTGGAGYIGSHVCKELNDKGFTPIVIDNLSTGKIERLKWGTHFINNISDTVQLSEIMDRYSPKSIMHFAAFSNVAESMEFPEKYYCNNVIESIQLLNNVINLGIKNIIYSSTCAVYGNPEKIPIDENIQPNPINPYGESKFIIERFLEWQGVINNINWISLRYFNVAGCDVDNGLGEDLKMSTRLIPRLIMAGIGYRKKFKLNGNSHPTEDGSAIRDFIHVHDIVDAHILALEALKHKKQNGYYNIGTENGYSVKNILAVVEKELNVSINVDNCPINSGDPPILIATNTKARKSLGWLPKYGIKDMINDTMNWAIHSVQ